jgi:hypothetical protein
MRAAVRLPQVRETLHQYQDLLERLTTGGLSRELTMELDQLLRSTPENLRTAVQIELGLFTQCAVDSHLSRSMRQA